jgi:hypothetical protein
MYMKRLQIDAVDGRSSKPPSAQYQTIRALQIDADFATLKALRIDPYPLTISISGVRRASFFAGTQPGIVRPDNR